MRNESRKDKSVTSAGYRSAARKKVSLSLLAAALSLCGCIANAASIPVPNGDFSDLANRGTIGGHLLDPPASAPIGAGPWDGAYTGILGSLAPPALTIRTGSATIGGLAGINLLGIVDNGGYFYQTLTTTWSANKHYVLSADVDVGGVLGSSVLSSGNIGLGLAIDGGGFITSTGTAPAGSISLSLLSGTKYHLSLAYNTGATVTGHITVGLLGQPQHLIGANLLSSGTFSNVKLTGSALNPVPASITPSQAGTPQGAIVNTAFASPLSVTVLDVDGDPVPNAVVTFAAPGSGASAGLSTTTATTDQNGVAQVTATANGTPGTYQVTATVTGVSPATFNLTNLAATATAITAAQGTPQHATVNTPFGQALEVTVTDAASHPVQGISVTFSAPTSGASATFPTGSIVVTDSSGHAQVFADANTTAGAYTVTASVNGVASSASFALTNDADIASQSAPTSGTPQSAMVSTPFHDPLVVTVTDAFGNPVSGVVITFTAPGSGPSATFPGTTIMVTTGANGQASIDPTANGIVGGPYPITATGAGIPDVVFNLTNTAGPTLVGDPTSGDGQSTMVGAGFNCLLQIKVTNNGTTPASNVSIDFVAPSSGASAMLTLGVQQGTTVTGLTDVNGMLSVTAAANSIAGKYTVSAGVTGSGTALATYSLTNISIADHVFANGFDPSPALCGQ